MWVLVLFFCIKNVPFFDVIIFFELRTIQQKTVIVRSSKRWLHRKFARFVLFRLIKKHSFNLLCVLDLFSERWQSTLFQIFLFFYSDFSSLYECKWLTQALLCETAYNCSLDCVCVCVFLCVYVCVVWWVRGGGYVGMDVCVRGCVSASAVLSIRNCVSCTSR